MTVKVFTYSDPQTLFTSQKMDLEQTIHVAATGNMAKAIGKKINQQSIQSISLNMNEFNRLIFEQWFSEETVLEQYLELTDYLDHFTYENPTIIESYKRNKNELLDTLRLFSFLAIKKERLNAILATDNFSEKESLLPELYEWFLNSQKNKSTLNLTIKSGEDLIEKIQGEENIQFYSKPTLIFHGFYFITPEQQRVMEVVQSLGFDIVFLNYYKTDYPKTFNFITKFINEEYGWPNAAEWDSLSSVGAIHLGDIFSSIFEGKTINQPELSLIKKYEFDNFTDFLSYIESNGYIETDLTGPRKNRMMTTNAHYMNNRMQEFYPENYRTVRNFLKYPIGYLLVQLHEMWNAENQKVEADKDQVLKILSTQYFFECKDEEYLLDAYKEISLFFINCQTQEQWMNQFDKLLALRLLIEEHLTHANSEVDKLHPKFDLDFNESPFSYLPYLSISSNNIESVREKVQAIFSLAKDLFSEEDSVIYLNNHFEKVLRIVDYSENHHSFDVLDQDILLELKAKLNAPINIREVNKNYLHDAIQFYLSGSANTDREDLIEPLISIDSELFQERKVHITGLDERGLPYGEYALPWPLSDNLVERLAVDNHYIKLLLYRNESIKQITRYLLHLMFKQADKIELSHLKNYEDNYDLNSSFYIDLMEEYIEVSSSKIGTPVDNEPIEKTKNSSYSIRQYSLDKKAKFAHYPKRLLYAKAAKQTSYASAFQQGFILSKLATFLLIAKNDRELVQEFLVDLFPQFDQFSIELALENSEKYKGSASRSFKSKDEVSDHRKQFLFPTLKWKDSEGSIDTLYQQAEAIQTVYDSDFYKPELLDSYIYPYTSIEYPEDMEGDA